MQEFEYLAMQLRLQRDMQAANPEAGTKDPYQMTHAELEVFIHWNFMALIKELSEATDEISWKPWASAEFVNYPECIREMVDAWHFFMNIMLGMAAMAKVPVDELAREFQDYYKTKNAKNLQRQIAGYDGLTTKCKWCKRELSETRYQAGIVTVGHDRWCSVNCYYDDPDHLEHEGENMSRHDPEEVARMGDDIMRRSGEGASASAEETTQAAQEAYLAKQQGATSPASFKDPATVFAEAQAEAEERDDAVEPDFSRPYATSPNPHAMKMVMEAEQTGEPLFCFRARDIFSIQVLVHYANIVEQYGPDNPTFLHNIVDGIGEFKEWQKDHIAEVRYPD